MITGRATTQGTRRFADRVAQPASYTQIVDGLWASSIGMGTYLGQPDESTDRAYQTALLQAIQLGCNVIDTAVNYRHQRSERAIGTVLAELFAEGAVQRDELIIATKGGFVPFDGALPADPGKWVHQHFISTGLAHANDFCANYQHCISPAYLEKMIETSRHNLGLETLDIYFLHNPETQRLSLSRETFRHRMLEAFEALEQAVEVGSIAAYGTATWTAYRALPKAPDYLSLAEIVSIACEVAGQGHHLRYIELPYNLFMTEAFALENQQLDDQMMSAIEVAGALGLTVFVSAPLMQGRLANPLMPQLDEIFPGLSSDAQRALQFVRSSPGVATALAGMSSGAHVQENLALLHHLPSEGSVIVDLFANS